MCPATVYNISHTPFMWDYNLKWKVLQYPNKSILQVQNLK